jgi:hypothetical protein
MPKYRVDVDGKTYEVTSPGLIDVEKTRAGIRADIAAQAKANAPKAPVQPQRSAVGAKQPAPKPAPNSFDKSISRVQNAPPIKTDAQGRQTHGSSAQFLKQALGTGNQLQRTYIEGTGANDSTGAYGLQPPPLMDLTSAPGEGVGMTDIAPHLPKLGIRATSGAISKGLGNGPISQEVYDSRAGRFMGHMEDYAPYFVPGVQGALLTAQGANLARGLADNPKKTIVDTLSGMNPVASNIDPEERVLRGVGLFLAVRAAAHGVNALSDAAEAASTKRLATDLKTQFGLDPEDADAVINGAKRAVKTGNFKYGGKLAGALRTFHDKITAAQTRPIAEAVAKAKTADSSAEAPTKALPQTAIGANATQVDTGPMAPTGPSAARGNWRGGSGYKKTPGAPTSQPESPAPTPPPPAPVQSQPEVTPQQVQPEAPAPAPAQTQPTPEPVEPETPAPSPAPESPELHNNASLVKLRRNLLKLNPDSEALDPFSDHKDADYNIDAVKRIFGNGPDDPRPAREILHDAQLAHYHQTERVKAMQDASPETKGMIAHAEDFLGKSSKPKKISGVTKNGEAVAIKQSSATKPGAQYGNGVPWVRNARGFYPDRRAASYVHMVPMKALPEAIKDSFTHFLHHEYNPPHDYHIGVLDADNALGTAKIKGGKRISDVIADGEYAPVGAVKAYIKHLKEGAPRTQAGMDNQLDNAEASDVELRHDQHQAAKALLKTGKAKTLDERPDASQVTDRRNARQKAYHDIQEAMSSKQPEYAKPHGGESEPAKMRAQAQANQLAQLKEGPGAGTEEPSAPKIDPEMASKAGTPDSEAQQPKKMSQHVPEAGIREDEGEVEMHAGLDLGKMLDDIFNRGKSGAKVDTSIGKRARNTFVENLSNLKEVDPESATLAKRVGAARAETNLIVRHAGPEIDKAAGQPGYWHQMRPALVASRLYGISTRWDNLANAVRNSTNADFEKYYPDDLSDVADRLGIDDEVGQLIASGETLKARQLVHDSFRAAAKRSKATASSIMSPADMQAFTSTPQFTNALAAYKHLVERPLSESHNSNDGIFTGALGPIDAYYPLIPLDENGKPQNRAQAGRKIAFNKPANRQNAFATGLADNYDTELPGLVNSVASAVRTNNKAALIKHLHEIGLIDILSPKSRATLGDHPTMKVRGIDMAAQAVPIKNDKLIVSQDGKPVFVPGQTALVPTWLAREMDPVLNGSVKLDDYDADNLLKKINMFGMSGPLDAYYHSSNVLGALVARTPFVGKSLASKTIGNTPITKRLNVIYQTIFKTDPSSPEFNDDVHELMRMGALPNSFAKSTYSKDYADASGAKLAGKPFTKGMAPTSFGPLLNGPSGLDIRARVVMLRVAKEMNPNASPEALAKMVDQLGVYNRVAESQIARAMKESGVGPFYTAGNAMYRNSVNAWLGRSKMPMEGLSKGQQIKYHLMHQMGGGIIGYVATWMLAYWAVTKLWPWEDKKSRFGQIPLPQDVSDKPIIRQIFHNKPGEPAYIDLSYFNPLVGRGARALGIRGAYDTAQDEPGGVLGQHNSIQQGQILDSGFKDIVNTGAHPFISGPATRGAFIGATGSEPFYTGDRDVTGGRGPQFLNVSPERGGGMAQKVENVKQGALRTNSALGNLAEAVGFLEKPSWQEKPKPGEKEADLDTKILGGVLAIAFPGLIPPQEDQASKSRTLAKSARTIKTKLDEQEGHPHTRIHLMR